VRCLQPWSWVLPPKSLTSGLAALSDVVGPATCFKSHIMANTWVSHLLPAPLVLHHGLELLLEAGQVAWVVHVGGGGGSRKRGDKVIEQRISLIDWLCFSSVVVLVGVIRWARRPFRGSRAAGPGGWGSTGVIWWVVANLENLYEFGCNNLLLILVKKL